MKRNSKKIISLFLVFVLLFSMSYSAFAAAAETVSGVSVTLSSNKKQYKSGEEIKIKTKVQNDTEDKQYVSIVYSATPLIKSTGMGKYSIKYAEVSGGETAEYEAMGTARRSVFSVEWIQSIYDAVFGSLWSAIYMIKAMFSSSYEAVSVKVDGVSAVVLAQVTSSETLPGEEDPTEPTEQYTVSFDLNYEGAPEIESQKINDGEVISPVEIPDREGYAFVGWYENINTSDRFDLESKIKRNILLHAKWVASDISIDDDNDKVSDFIESFFGSDTKMVDTDNDGLTDYEEIYLTSTEPTLYDTDNNGVSDADEDADKDGLKNIDEINFKTNPLVADTDFDNLSDYDEIYIYKTNPLIADSDGDGLNDGDEVALGLDPNLQKTDGKALDSERIIQQAINNDRFDGDLLSNDNKAIPSLTVSAKGNANSTIEIKESDSYYFNDSRALIGTPICIAGSSFDNGELSFRIDNSDKNSLKNMLVCKYDEETNNPVYYNTELDVENNTIKAEIDGVGTYYVMDVKALFSELSIPYPEITAAKSARRLSAKGRALESGVVKSDISTKAQADIVFIVDTTGSMSGSIANVRNNIISFVDLLNKKGISASLALVEYRDIEEDGYASTKVHKNDSSNWFYDVEEYKNRIASLGADGGGDTPESAVDALETARLLDMRPSAGKIFVLITDANYKTYNRYGIESMADEIELLKNAGVNCSVVTTNSYKLCYENLYETTGGIFANINGSFSNELEKIASRIGDEIVGDGCWIYLQGAIPTPVRLNSKPKKGSSEDTDKDGISDIDELGSEIPTGYIDLDEIIQIVSKGTISGTTYGKVPTYKYKSNPILVDSDFDGISDNDDTDKLSATFNGVLHGYYDVSPASYTMDFREFFKNPTKHSRKISSASLVFSNTIYGQSFDYTSGYDKNISNISEMLKIHGFNKDEIVDYHLDTDYHDDDISEVAIGNKVVNYNGREKTVIAVIIRGTNGKVEEWSSNFDMGDPKSWKSIHHKGFYTTEERIYKKLSEYIREFINSSEDTVFWVTGHSRGAALANLLSAKLIDDGKTVFGYTFATPSTTTDANKNSNKYSSIFNYTNTSDVVSYVPLEAWGFGRYGITKQYNMDSPTLKAKWSELTGRENYNGLNQSVINLILNRITSSCAPNWSSVYDQAGSQDISDKQLSYISERAKRYCTITERKSLFSGKHKGWKLYPSTAFIFQLGAEALSSETEGKGDLLFELWNSRYAAVVLLMIADAIVRIKGYNVIDTTLNIKSILNNWPSEIGESLAGDGHAPATYYVFVHYA